MKSNSILLSEQSTGTRLGWLDKDILVGAYRGIQDIKNKNELNQQQTEFEGIMEKFRKGIKTVLKWGKREKEQNEIRVNQDVNNLSKNNNIINFPILKSVEEDDDNSNIHYTDVPYEKISGDTVYCNGATGNPENYRGGRISGGQTIEKSGHKSGNFSKKIIDEIRQSGAFPIFDGLPTGNKKEEFIQKFEDSKKREMMIATELKKIKQNRSNTGDLARARAKAIKRVDLFIAANDEKRIDAANDEKKSKGQIDFMGQSVEESDQKITHKFNSFNKFSTIPLIKKTGKLAAMIVGLSFSSVNHNTNEYQTGENNSSPNQEQTIKKEITTNEYIFNLNDSLEKNTTQYVPKVSIGAISEEELAQLRRNRISKEYTINPLDMDVSLEPEMDELRISMNEQRKDLEISQRSSLIPQFINEYNKLKEVRSHLTKDDVLLRIQENDNILEGNIKYFDILFSMLNNSNGDLTKIPNKVFSKILGEFGRKEVIETMRNFPTQTLSKSKIENLATKAIKDRASNELLSIFGTRNQKDFLAQYLIALINQESNRNAFAISTTDAVGLFQFISKNYRASTLLGESFYPGNPEMNIAAAIELLNDNYRMVKKFISKNPLLQDKLLSLDIRRKDSILRDTLLVYHNRGPKHAEEYIQSFLLGEEISTNSQCLNEWKKVIDCPTGSINTINPPILSYIDKVNNNVTIDLSKFYKPEEIVIEVSNVSTQAKAEIETTIPNNNG